MQHVKLIRLKERQKLDFFEYNIEEEGKYFPITNNHVLYLNLINNNNYISITYKNKEEKLD